MGNDMKRTKFYLILFMSIFPLISYSQVIYSPYLSVGYMNHLSRDGINSEVGIDFEISKRFNISTGFRYSLLEKNTDNEVETKALSLFLSYIAINSAHHKLMLGPGISYGIYKRYTEYIGFEKEYKHYWLNPIKLRYDYVLNSKIKLGLDASVYGDDGDVALYLGFVTGYVF